MHLRTFCTPTSATAAGCVAIAVAGLLTSAVSASAEGPAVLAEAAASPVLLAAPSPDLPGLPETAIELAQVPVSSAALRREAEQYGRIDADHTLARDERVGLDRAATDLRAARTRLEVQRVAAHARSEALTTRLSDVEQAIQALAVRSLVSGTEDERLEAAVSSETPAISEVERGAVLAGVSMEVLLTERAAYRARITEADARAATAGRDLDEVRASLEQIGSERPEAVVREERNGGLVATARVSYEQARVLATVDGVEFPLVALDAYYRAASATSAERPGCNVRWWGLAGISAVEGHHGTYGGATLDANGDTSRRIIGIQLDGTQATAVVGDSDGGKYDGDPYFDRAVGPMQFIPQTWARFQADGNGDGTRSPFNLYDATLAAADYLCTASGGLDADPGLRTAYLAYNQSLVYVDSVLGYAHRYEQAVALPDPRT